MSKPCRRRLIITSLITIILIIIRLRIVIHLMAGHRACHFTTVAAIRVADTTAAGMVDQVVAGMGLRLVAGGTRVHQLAVRVEADLLEAGMSACAANEYLRFMAGADIPLISQSHPTVSALPAQRCSLPPSEWQEI